MIICSALYYAGSLDRPESLVRDNRWYPGKAVECFPLWWSYLRKHYPDTHVVLFADTGSPISWQDIIKMIPESIDVTTREILAMSILGTPKVHIVPLSEHCGKYFWPMQRNLVEAMVLGYQLSDGMLWIDGDCFCNTCLTPFVQNLDMGSSSVEHHQMTCGSICWYISDQRLHSLDVCGVHLPTYLYSILNDGPTETRMHSLQEGGLYKHFWYGNAKTFDHIHMSHLSCYEHFMRYLVENPLDTSEYQDLVAHLASLDMTRLNGVQLRFHDALHTEHDGIITEYN